MAELGSPRRSESITRLHGLVASLPEVTGRAARAALHPPRRSGAVSRWVVTGGGLAEGPAQALVQTLVEDAQIDARFVPQSAFIGRDPRWRDAGLVVFSQGTSPNGQLAMARAADFSSAWLVTARPADDVVVARWMAAGHGVVWHPAADSDGTLIRIHGPAAAIIAGWRLALELLSCPGADPAHADRQADRYGDRVWRDAVARSVDHVRAGQRAATAVIGDAAPDAWSRPLAILTQGPWRDALQAAAWCWLEGAWRRQPPVWDVLQIAHGPMQERWNNPTTWLHVQREGDPDGDGIHGRICAMFAGTPHQVARLRVCSGPAAVLEALAATQVLVLRALDASPGRDLVEWPGKGRDQPIYGYTAGDASDLP